MAGESNARRHLSSCPPALLDLLSHETAPVTMWIEQKRFLVRFHRRRPGILLRMAHAQQDLDEGIVADLSLLHAEEEMVALAGQVTGLHGAAPKKRSVRKKLLARIEQFISPRLTNVVANCKNSS